VIMAREKADKRRRRAKLRSARLGQDAGLRQIEPPRSEYRPIDVRVLLDSVPSMDLKELPDAIDALRDPEYTNWQDSMIAACLRRVLRDGNPESTADPRVEQTQTMRRLIYCSGDVLLIARTGFGKSLIFQAFSILTRLVTLQIIPMSRLGEEQYDGIRRLPGTNPGLITHQNKQRTRGLLLQVSNGEYTHILLGPEQACSKDFRAALKRISFRDRIGLVAIDEAHFIRQWGVEFRTEFMAICELRQVLPREVVWFCCTATAGALTQWFIQAYSGLREVGLGPYQTQVIRTTIDRPEVALLRLIIPRGMGGSGKGEYQLLDFLLDGCCDENIAATPLAIPKTAIFIDGKAKIRDCVLYLQKVLMRTTQDGSDDSRYSYNRYSGALCVFDVIQEFTADVAEHDQVLRYQEFIKPTSKIRIMIATTLLGTGMNMPDVERVVIWKIPLGELIEELWQRIGRCARAIAAGIAYIFLQHWLFDTEGCERVGQKQIVIQQQQLKSKSSKGRKRGMVGAAVTAAARQMMIQSQGSSQSQFQPSQGSALRNVVNHNNDSDVESMNSFASSDTSQTSRDSDGACSESGAQKGKRGRRAPDGRLYWSDKELGYRCKVERVWLQLANHACVGIVILAECGQDMIHSPRPTNRCCNGPKHGDDAVPTPELPTKPAIGKVRPKLPSTGTRSRLALDDFINAWAAEVATEVYCDGPETRFMMPPSAGMPDPTRWQLASLFLKRTKFVFRSDLTLDQVCTAVPEVREWEFVEQFGDRLACFLGSIYIRVSELGDAMDRAAQEKKRQKQVPAIVPIVMATPSVTVVKEAQARQTAITAAAVGVGRVMSGLSRLGELTAHDLQWGDRLRIPGAQLTPPTSQTPAALARLYNATMVARSGSLSQLDSPIDSQVESQAVESQAGDTETQVIEPYTEPQWTQPAMPTPAHTQPTLSVTPMASTPSQPARRKRKALSEIASNIQRRPTSTDLGTATTRKSARARKPTAVAKAMNWDDV
jgi:superfamily II DNA helicase RecQ